MTRVPSVAPSIEIDEESGDEDDEDDEEGDDSQQVEDNVADAEVEEDSDGDEDSDSDSDSDSEDWNLDSDSSEFRAGARRSEIGEDAFENNRYFIKRLEKNDPTLFKFKGPQAYSRKCQASNNMQPLVVISEDYINQQRFKKHRWSQRLVYLTEKIILLEDSY